MANAKRNPKPSVLPFNQSFDLAKRLAEHYVTIEKLTEHQAWMLAGRLLDPAFSESYDLATISQLDYSTKPRNEAMVKTAKDKRATNGAELNGHARKLTRAKMPTGSGWVERIARGLRRWRESQGLSMPAASKKFGVDQQIWYGIEGGEKPQKTGKNLDILCQKIGVDNIELQQLGMDP